MKITTKDIEIVLIAIEFLRSECYDKLKYYRNDNFTYYEYLEAADTVKAKIFDSCDFNLSSRDIKMNEIFDLFEDVNMTDLRVLYSKISRYPTGQVILAKIIANEILTERNNEIIDNIRFEKFQSTEQKGE